MMRVRGCEIVSDMLQAFVDGELPVEEQVDVEVHLRWCRTCAARVEDMQLIGGAVRLGAPASFGADEDSRDLSAISDGVLARIRAEHEQSFSMQVRELFDDMRVWWQAIGATSAVLFCLGATMGVLHAAGDRRPDSLAGVIQSLADPGSDRNPVRLGSHIEAPRALGAPPALESFPEEEAVFALSTVVTREGRIANYQLLQSERASVRRRNGLAHGDDVGALLDAVRRSRFEPAQSGGAPVAVSMVWLLARTTVKGSFRALDFELPAAAPHTPAVTPAAQPKTEAAPAEGEQTVPRRATRSTTTV